LPVIWIGAAIIVGLPCLAWLIGGAPTQMSVPELKGFNFEGGYNISPVFLTEPAATAIYTSAYVAEITRAGIMAVSHGQTEAGRSLGLSEAVIMRKVILPQALRVIIPPTTNQYLNLTKNSSLSVAVGYPDLVSVGNTTLNQTGQAIEVIVIFMAVYLTTSLVTSLIMNWYNRRIQLVER
jgi:general L-amino acid transport system permease protein